MIAFIEYNNQIFPKKSRIHLRACDDAPSYLCPSPNNVSKIQKLDCILNFFPYCHKMNKTYLESS